MAGSHYSQIPDVIWEYMQGKFGVRNPSSRIRDILMSWMAEDMQKKVEAQAKGEPEPEPEDDFFEKQWKSIGCGLDEVDDEFTDARKAFVIKMNNDEQAAINYFTTHPTIKEPRAWICAWYKDQKQRGFGLA